MFSLNMFNSFKKLGINTVYQTHKKYFGKNEKAIKMRIKSVGSIEKITKAMKMVNNINN
jgi:uncharacterized membrane protein